MNHSPRFWLALSGLALLAIAPAADAWPHYPPSVHFNLDCRFDVRFANKAYFQKLAPWYAYFPQGEFQTPNQVSHYPTWPTPFPPAPTPEAAPAPAAPNMTQSPGWPAIYQPAGYSLGAAPSSWYGR